MAGSGGPTYTVFDDDYSGYGLRRKDPGQWATEGNAQRNERGERLDDVNYGGSGGAAARAVAEQQGRSDASRSRQGYGWDWNAYNQATGWGGQARGGQEAGLRMLRDKMDLSRGSEASYGTLAAGRQAAADQASMATLARGGQVGQIAAARAAQGQGLLIGQQSAEQANLVRQREAQQAALQYGAAASEMRRGDAAQTGLAQQQAMSVGEEDLRNRASNARRERGAEEMLDNIYKTQMTSQLGVAQRQQAFDAAFEAARRGDAAAALQAQNAGLGAFATGLAAAGKFGEAIGGAFDSQPAANGYGPYSGGIYRNPYG